MATSDLGKATAVAGSSLAIATGVAWYSSSLKSVTSSVQPSIHGSTIMIVLVVTGIALFVGGTLWAWLAGKKEENRKDDKESLRDKRQIDRWAEEDRRRNLDDTEAKVQAGEAETKRDKVDEANQVKEDQEKLSNLQPMSLVHQPDAYTSFLNANRMCRNCKTMYPRRQFLKNDLVDRHNWLICACYGCATTLWPRGKHERMWLDDYNQQIRRV